MGSLKQEQIEHFAFGKPAPQAVPLEEAVLGALLLDRDALGLVDATIQADSFYLEAHQHIYRCIVSLAERSIPVDLLTVTDELKKTGNLDAIGGGYYLVELCNRVASAANIEYHARIIAQKHIQRAIIQAGMAAVRNGYDDTIDVFNQLDELEKSVFSIASGAHQSAATGAGDIAIQVLKSAAQAMQSKGLTGVPGGLTVVDNQTGGWQPTDLIILAGRPGMGKSAFAAQNAVNPILRGTPVELYSLEMSKDQIMQRLISQKAKINSQNINTGKVTELYL